MEIDYEEINRTEKYNSLSSKLVYDYAEGVADYEHYEKASVTKNKTSVYLFLGSREMGLYNITNILCVARVVNISTSNIDGVYDMPLCGDILRELASDYATNEKDSEPKYHFRMNRRAYDQLLRWWWDKKECKEPEALATFANVGIVIDDRIQNNQETVI